MEDVEIGLCHERRKSFPADMKTDVIFLSQQAGETKAVRSERKDMMSSDGLMDKASLTHAKNVQEEGKDL